MSSKGQKEHAFSLKSNPYSDPMRLASPSPSLEDESEVYRAKKLAHHPSHDLQPVLCGPKAYKASCAATLILKWPGCPIAGC